MTDYYPPVNFHFKVEFELSKQTSDVWFQSVSGLEVQLETEAIKEGGENRFTHQLPTRRKYTDLTLKRGMLLPEQSEVTKWCKDTFDNGIIKPTNLNVIMLNEAHEPLLTWKVRWAWPKSWKFNELNAEKGEVFLETLTLVYNGFRTE